MMRGIIAFVLLGAMSLCAERTTPAVFYVDDLKGSDLAAGDSPESAWRSLVQVNIIYRNNIIWNAEYSFEYWNRPGSAITKNVIFEHNTCIDAGCGWAHSQRPDKNGAHLMFYQNSAQTSGLVVRNNIFVNSTEVITRMENDWRSGLAMHNNLLFQSEKPIMRWLIRNYYGKEEFSKYQAELNLDQKSVFARPSFKDPAKRDYTMMPGSTGCSLATDGGAVGVR